MGRRRKGPWWHKGKQSYVTTRPGSKKIVELGTEEAAAKKLYHQLMSEWVDDIGPPSTLTWTVAHLVDEFLEWCKHNRSDGTYKWYKRYLNPV